MTLVRTGTCPVFGGPLLMLTQEAWDMELMSDRRWDGASWNLGTRIIRTEEFDEEDEELEGCPGIVNATDMVLHPTKGYIEDGGATVGYGPYTTLGEWLKANLGVPGPTELEHR